MHMQYSYGVPLIALILYSIIPFVDVFCYPFNLLIIFNFFHLHASILASSASSILSLFYTISLLGFSFFVIFWQISSSLRDNQDLISLHATLVFLFLFRTARITTLLQTIHLLEVRNKITPGLSMHTSISTSLLLYSFTSFTACHSYSNPPYQATLLHFYLVSFFSCCCPLFPSSLPF